MTDRLLHFWASLRDFPKEKAVKISSAFVLVLSIIAISVTASKFSTAFLTPNASKGLLALSCFAFGAALLALWSLTQLSFLRRFTAICVLVLIIMLTYAGFIALAWTPDHEAISRAAIAYWNSLTPEEQSNTASSAAALTSDAEDNLRSIAIASSFCEVSLLICLAILVSLRSEVANDKYRASKAKTDRQSTEERRKARAREAELQQRHKPYRNKKEEKYRAVEDLGAGLGAVDENLLAQEIRPSEPKDEDQSQKNFYTIDIKKPVFLKDFSDINDTEACKQQMMNKAKRATLEQTAKRRKKKSRRHKHGKRHSSRNTDSDLKPEIGSIIKQTDRSASSSATAPPLSPRNNAPLTEEKTNFRTKLLNELTPLPPRLEPVVYSPWKFIRGPEALSLSARTAKLPPIKTPPPSSPISPDPYPPIEPSSATLSKHEDQSLDVLEQVDVEAARQGSLFHTTPSPPALTLPKPLRTFTRRLEPIPPTAQSDVNVNISSAQK